MPSNELNLADFQKIIFLNNIEESSEISDINNIFKYAENSNEKFDFAVFFTEQDKSNIQNLDNAEQYPNKIINIWNKGQRLNRFIGIDKANNEIITEEKTYKLLFSPNDGLISVIDQKKILIIIGEPVAPYKDASFTLQEVYVDPETKEEKQRDIPENLRSKIKWLSSNSDIKLDPNNVNDTALFKIDQSIKTYGKFTLTSNLNEQTPDKLKDIKLSIKWYCLNGTTSSLFSCDSSHIFSTKITAKLTGYQTATTSEFQLIKNAECPSPNEIKIKITKSGSIEAGKEYSIQNWPDDKRKTDYNGTDNLPPLTDWSLKPGTYNIITIAPAIENGNDSLQITVNEIPPMLKIGSNSSNLTEYDVNTNNTISAEAGTALCATVSIEDPTKPNHLQSINRQFNGTITYWEDGNNNKIYEVQYVGVPLKLDGVGITNIVGNKNSTKLHVRFTPNRSDNTYIYYGAIQNAEITLKLMQKQTTLSLNGIETTYDGNNHYITGKPSITGTIRYKQYTDTIPNISDLKSHGNSLPGAVAGRNCNLSDISPSNAGSYHIAAYLDPDDDNYTDSGVVTSLITIKKANTSLVFNGSSNTYNGSKQGGFTIKITATPAVEGKLYYSTSQDLSNASTALVNTSHYTGFITATVSVTLPSNMQQTEVGNYPIYVKFIPDDTQNYNESTTNGTFSIIQSSANITISDYSANYNGAKQGYIRVTPPFSGKVHYGLSENNLQYYKEVSNTTPVELDNQNIQVKHVNTSSPRIVYVQFEPANTNYKNSSIYTATITIKKAKPTLTLSSSSIQYSNTANKASATVTGIGTDQMTGTIYYVAGDVITSQTQAHQKKYNNAAITLDNVSQTDAGSIKLTAQFAPDNAVRDGVKLSDDYELSDAKSITITVTKAPQSAPIAKGDTQKYPYPYSVKATASGGGGQGSLIWVNGNNDNTTSNEIPANSAPTSKNVRAYWSGNNNYEPSPKSNTVTIEITKGNPIIPPAGSSTVTFNESKLTYDGTKKVLINTKFTPFNGKIYWYVSTSSTTPTWSTTANSGWSLEIPSKIEPGTYYVWYYVELNSNLYNDPGTFYNKVTKVTETSAASGADGYETNHKTIYKIKATLKINGTTVTSSPVTGYTGTYNGGLYAGTNQGKFTLTPSTTGYAEYNINSKSSNPASIININANETVTIDAGNEYGIKNAGTYTINIYFHPSDTAHYIDSYGEDGVNAQVKIIINPKKLDKPQISANNATYGATTVGALVSFKLYQVYISGGRNKPDTEWYYRSSTSNTWTSSGSAPILKEAGSMVVKAIYKNSVNGVVDNNWESSDESDEITVTMYKRTVTITPPEFTTETLTYNRKSQALIKSGTGSCTAGGTIYYYVSKNNATPPPWTGSLVSTGWVTSKPHKTEAGTYYVWWYCYVPDTTNNTGTNINTVNRISGYKSINKATPWPNPAPRLVTDHIVLDGKWHNLLQGGTMYCGPTNNAWYVPGTFQYEQGRNLNCYYNPHWWFTPRDGTNYKSVDGSVNGEVWIYPY